MNLVHWDDPIVRVFAWCGGICLALAVSAIVTLRLPHRPKGSLEAPLAGDPDPVWERFVRSSRTLEQLISGLPIGLVLFTAVFGARGVRESPWAMVVVIVAVAVAALWVTPGLKRERDFVRRLLEARGAPRGELADADFIEVWEGDPPDPDHEPWEGLGFVCFGEDGATFHTPAERLSVPRSAVQEIEARSGSVHPLGLAWTVPSGAKRTVYFVARGGEHRLAHHRAARDLAERLAAWHDATSHLENT